LWYHHIAQEAFTDFSTRAACQFQTCKFMFLQES
jgi:hypothetical protein